MLRVSNLTKQYKSNVALSDANIDIVEGHIYGVIGPNGAGKTTLFKMLAGLVKPTSGEIIVKSGEKIEDYRCNMGFMIENPYLYTGMTAMQNMRIIGGIKGVNDEKRLKEVLELVGLGETGNKKVKQFSLGMKQRLGIACALVSNPKILVLDEPMNGVDPEGVVDMRCFLLELNQKHNITLLVSSHNLYELENISTDFIFVKEGKVVKSISKSDMNISLEEYYMKEIVER